MYRPAVIYIYCAVHMQSQMVARVRCGMPKVAEEGALMQKSNHFPVACAGLEPVGQRVWDYAI